MNEVRRQTLKLLLGGAAAGLLQAEPKDQLPPGVRYDAGRVSPILAKLEKLIVEYDEAIIAYSKYMEEYNKLIALDDPYDPSYLKRVEWIQHNIHELLRQLAGREPRVVPDV